MVLRTNVVNAFASLGLETDADFSEARLAYKKLALQHHPDKNYGDYEATQKFQEVSAAWEIVQRHYDNPASSHQPEGFSSGRGDDEDGFEDEEEMAFFFQFMFEEIMRGMAGNRRGFREQKRSSGGRPFAFSMGGNIFMFGGGPPPQSSRSSYGPSYGYSSSRSYSRNESSYARVKDTKTQEQKDKEAYQKRMKEWEAEIAREQAELDKRMKDKKNADRAREQARSRCFTAARNGDLQSLKADAQQYNIDVTVARGGNKETMLHVAAAGKGTPEVAAFLIEKGLSVDALTNEKYTPFHLAAMNGNLSLVQYIHTSHPKLCHPSKATERGTTPLQLALQSENPDVVRYLVKYAPVHDVTTCWNTVEVNLEGAENDAERSKWENIRKVLQTKRGFQPFAGPESPVETEASLPGFGEGTSKKARARANKRERERQDALEAEARAVAEKEARLADERKRAEEKIRKKEERKREKEEAIRRAAEEAERQVREVEQRQRDEEERVRRAEEEKKRAEIEAMEKAKREKAEAEKRKRQEDERKRKAEERRIKEEERKRKEDERKVKEEIERVRREEADRIRREEQEEEKRRQVEEERTQKQVEEAERQARSEEEEKARVAEEKRKLLVKARLEEERLKKERWEQKKQADVEKNRQKQKEQTAKLRAEREALEKERKATKPDHAQATPSYGAAPLSPPKTPEHIANVSFDGPLPSYDEGLQTAVAADYLFDPPPVVRRRVKIPQRAPRTYDNVSSVHPTPKSAVRELASPAEWTEASSVTPLEEAYVHREGVPRGRGRGRPRGFFRGRGRGRGRGGRGVAVE
ncbi:ankyrin [Stereum hirsutum FP-91666 SS1]|uniref:ankyrin n=1 Tax=Stereum hirsutum (strain FP-91666) TaxID=721885 RepID=UPI000440B3EA|nr:ankyrin [Stereum hirsutum FP-91666 SS1]EIM89545.1 ankyrin [Stereum hirsutum FP-91666 SS1]